MLSYFRFCRSRKLGGRRLLVNERFSSEGAESFHCVCKSMNFVEVVVRIIQSEPKSRVSFVPIGICLNTLWQLLPYLTWVWNCQKRMFWRFCFHTWEHVRIWLFLHLYCWPSWVPYLQVFITILPQFLFACEEV